MCIRDRVSLLDRKLWRDIAAMRGQVVTIALVVAAGVAVFVGSISTYDSLLAGRERFYAQARFPYIFDADMRPLPGTSKPEGEGRPISDGDGVQVGDASIEAIAVPPGRMRVLAFRAGPLGFGTDAKTAPPAASGRRRGARGRRSGG